MANCTLFILGGFPVRESNPGPWSQAPNHQPKNVVFSLVSEKVVQGQSHKGQGHRGQIRKWRSNIVRVKAVGQGHRVMVRYIGGAFYPIDSREVRHAGVFIKSLTDKLIFLSLSATHFSSIKLCIRSITNLEILFFFFLLLRYSSSLSEYLPIFTPENIKANIVEPGWTNWLCSFSQILVRYLFINFRETKYGSRRVFRLFGDSTCTISESTKRALLMAQTEHVLNWVKLV